MSQPDRMMHDKATILAIIKYFLITAVVLLLIYLGFRIFAILLPFVFGFILARLAIEAGLPEGVYAQFPGPHYETPAEVAMAGRMGADLVGMSTALEAIAARHAGLEVLGISLVTNLAAGVGAEPLAHDEVIEAGRAAGPRISRLLADVVGRIG